MDNSKKKDENDLGILFDYCVPLRTTEDSTSSHTPEENPLIDDEYETNDYHIESEVRRLFKHIDAYSPEDVEIEPMLKPFLIDYVPAIGDVDNFIKIPRPDKVASVLGLTVLDEPATKQSDPTILGMQLRSTKKDGNAEILVKKLERAEKNEQEIEKWIGNIKELHRAKLPDSVNYSKKMPDIEFLMQEWPNELEELLKTERLPSASLDATLEEYADICLSLLDIPIHKSRIESLHVLFTLFAEFRNSQHFHNLAGNNQMSCADKKKEAERLEL